MKIRDLLGVAFLAIGEFCIPSASLAQTIDTRPTTIESNRRDSTGKYVRIGLAIDNATPTANSESKSPKAVFLVLPSVEKPVVGSDASAPQSLPHEPRHFPLYRNRASLVQANVALAWMGWPSESIFGISGVTHPDFKKDIAAVITYLRGKWPQTKVILVGTNGGTMTALSYALDQKDSIDGMLILSPFWMNERHNKVEALQSLQTLVIQDSSGECLAASAVEVTEISRRAGFTYLPVNALSAGGINNCGVRSANWLPNIDSVFSETITRWLDAQLLPSSLGHGTLIRSVLERVILIPAKSGDIETTIYTPQGKGPFPLVVFNHGDMEMEYSWVKYRSRYTDLTISAPFLRAGLAVAIPARPGVGRSDGRYSYSHYSVNDGDPTYKARQHSVAVLAALEGLKAQNDLDMSRIVIAGQSAGGDTVMYMSTLALTGVKGVINFAGGRSNHSSISSANFENSMMISGWGALGKQASHPALLIFAENDSRYSANTIRKSAQAFTDAGGKAELQLFPAITGDGHYIHRRPDLWLPATTQFLKAIGILP